MFQISILHRCVCLTSRPCLPLPDHPHPLSGNQLSTSGNLRSTSSWWLTGGNFTLLAMSGTGEGVLLSCEDGATSSCSICKDETLFVETMRGRRCGLSFVFCENEADGMVESGGRDGGGEGSGSSEEMEIGGGGGSLCLKDSDLDGERVLVSLSWGWPCEIFDLAEAALRAEGSLLMAAEEGKYSPLLTFDSISLSPACLPRLNSDTLLILPLVLFVPPVPLRLLFGVFAFSLPSMILALGGGCNIHWVSLRLVGWVLTTGGCRSLISGFRA